MTGLEYQYEEASGIGFNIEGDIIRIWLEEGFIGEGYSYVTATDGISTAVSNTFKIEYLKPQSDSLLQMPAEIGKPVRWIKTWKSSHEDIGLKKIEIELPQGSTIIKYTKDGEEKEKDRVKLKDKKNNTETWEIEDGINATNETIIIELETEAPQLIDQGISGYVHTVVVSSELNYTNVTTYVNIAEVPERAIRVFWLTEEGRLDISELPELGLEMLDSDRNGLVDRLKWITPHLSNQTFEIEITVLNVQSYPTVGGYWDVYLNTTGAANLTITASNGTAYTETEIDDANTTDDLEIIELRCGEDVIFSKPDRIHDNSTFFILSNGSHVPASQIYNMSHDDESFCYNSYTCNDTARWRVKVHTAGVHIQEFNFGGFKEYAFNDASSVPNQTCPILNSTFGTNFTDENLTVYNQSTYDGDDDPVKNIINWYLDGNSVTVLNMPFEGGSNSTWTKDYSGNDNNGAVAGATWNSTGGYEGKGAYQFDGENDHINLGNPESLNLSDEFSLEAWFYPLNNTLGEEIDGIITKGGVWDENSSYSLSYVPNTTDIRAQIRWGPDLLNITTITAQMPLERWIHAVMTYDDGLLSLYVNGTLYDTDNVPEGESMLTNDYDVWIGGASTDSETRYFNGTIDEARIWSIALSPEQILALYNNRTDLIVSQETTKGGIWKACVTPNDGYIDGAENCSSNLTILNKPSEHDTPILNSSSGMNRTAENLTVYNQSTYDADNDPVKNIINWHKDGAPIIVLNMPFEGGSNSTWTKDYSGFGNYGNVTGAIWNATGGHDSKGAYHFNNDHIDLPNNLDYTSQFSAFAWFKAAGTPIGGYHIIFGGQELEMDVTTAGVLRTGLYTNARYVSNHGLGLADGNWHHIGFTFNGSNKRSYIDGQDVGNLSVEGTLTYSFANRKIGRFGSSTGYYLNGSVDDLLIYNYSLSDQQVYALYSNRTDLIVSQETDVGETWKACITPNDGYADGTELCSNNLTINTPPSQTTPFLNSTDGLNKTDENLTVYNQSTYDAEDDDVKNIISWYKDSNPIAMVNAPFEGGSTSSLAKDYSGSGNNGSVTGPTWRIDAGYDGRGTYEFDGDGDYINFSEQLADDTATFGGWIYSNDLGCSGDGWCMVMGQDNSDYEGYEFYTWYTGIACWDGNTEANTNEIAANEWHHVMCRNNGTDVAIFVDGELKDTTASSWSPVSSDFVVGGHPWTDDAWWDGYIDDVMIFDTALSDEQIALIASNRTDMTASQETTKGDEWQACITPNDGNEDGAENCSNTLTIGNAIPEHGTPILNSTYGTNYTDENLTAYNQSTYDADQDNVTNIINWYKDGKSLMTVNMPFDTNISTEESGAVRDYSGYENNGTLGAGTPANMPAWINDGISGGAYEFDGTNDRIRLDSFSNLNTSTGTVSYWARFNTNGTAQLLFHIFESTYTDYIRSYVGPTTSRMDLVIEDDDATKISVYYDLDNLGTWWDQWMHIAWVQDGTSVKLYINGSQKSLTGTNSGDWWTDHLDITSASLGGPTWGYLNGSMDEFQVHDHALSPEQILAIYESGADNEKPFTLVSQETTKGETWKACITPNDGHNDGEELCSSNLTIQNKPPEHATPILNATSIYNRTTDNLTVYNQSTSDLEDDNVKNIINWYIDDASLMMLNMPFEGNDEQESTLAKDYSGNGNNGTVSGATWSDDVGYDGFGAYSFDGTDDFVHIQNDFNLEIQDFTITAWVNYTGDTDNMTLYSQIDADCGDNSSMWFGISDGKLKAEIKDSDSDTITSISNTSLSSGWHHAVMKLDSSTETIRLYIDGALTNTSNGSVGFGPNSLAAIGAEYDCDGQTEYKLNGTHHGYFFIDTDLPTDEEPGYGTEYTSGQYTQANISDDSRATYTPFYSSGNNHEVTQYSIIVPEDAASFTLTWEGYNTLTTSGTGVNIYAYNFDNSEWDLITSTTGSTETTLSGAFSAQGHVQDGTNEIWITAESRGVNCYCSLWINGECGGGRCLSTERYQTRSCTPDLCDNEWRCVSDPNCGGTLSTKVSALKGWVNITEHPKSVQGFGESLDYNEQEECYGDYCHMDEGETVQAIDEAIGKGVDFLLNTTMFEQESWDDQFNHMFLLRMINNYLNREDINKTIDEMLDTYIEQNKVPNGYQTILSLLSQVNPERFDEKQGLTYNMLRSGVPDHVDFAYHNNELGVAASYCQRFFPTYTEEDKQKLIGYLTGLGLNDSELGNESHYYRTTHSLMYLETMYRQGCVGYDLVEKAISYHLLRNKLFTHAFSDWHLEGPAMLAIIGRTDLYKDGWVPIILENQEDDGGWPVVAEITYSHSHPTGLAVLALLAYKEHEIDGKTYRMRMPFEDTLEEGLGVWGHNPPSESQCSCSCTPDEELSHNTMYVDYVVLYKNSLKNHFNGTIDEFRIYNTSLSESQILMLYQNRTDLIVSQETGAGETWKACITPNDRSDDGEELCSNEITITSLTSTNCTVGCYYIRNSTGGNVTIFDSFGNIDTKGQVFQSGVGVPDGDDMIFRNASDSTVAWIDSGTGNIRLRGSMSQEQGGYCTPSVGAFIIKDESENCVSYIDKNGNLWARGSVVQNAIIN
ncbi:LamG domain-containing protein [Candidatus Woesearchaeota archaeon]|nr:LamG domain-containing protein [Candidatus Woesearchaeota archaeon]